MHMKQKQIDKIINMLTITDDQGTLLSIQKGKKQKDHPFYHELESYLKQERATFTVRYQLNKDLPPFTLKVLEAISAIPYGETKTYQAIANAIGHPKASRAVGNVCAKNKLLFLIPCHRVVGKNSLGAYQLGEEIKAALLQLEHKKTHRSELDFLSGGE